MWRSPSFNSSSVSVPAHGPTASPSRLRTRMMLKARSRIASGFSSISGLRTLPARGILTWEKSGTSPGRHSGSGTCKDSTTSSLMRGTLETGLATGLANLQNVERENFKLFPELSETLSASDCHFAGLAPPIRHGADILRRHHPHSQWKGFKIKGRLYYVSFGTLLRIRFVHASQQPSILCMKQPYYRG